MHKHDHNHFGTSTSIFGHRNALTANKIEEIAKSGIEYIEIGALQEQHINLYDEERINELARAINKFGLKVWSLHAPFCALAMDDADTRQEGIRKLKRAAVVADRFEAKYVIVHPGRDVPSVDRERELKWMVEGTLKALEDIPERINLTVETMVKESLGSPPDEMRYIMDELPEERTGVCLDTGHVKLGNDIHDYMNKFKNRIYTVHLHDNKGIKDDHFRPGRGTLDWPKVLETLRGTGYDGPLINEGDGDNLEDPIAAKAQSFVDHMGKCCV